MNKKRRQILKAVAAGHSCEQILASDSTITYHDIFHALTEAPTSYWLQARAKSSGKSSVETAASVRRPARQRAD